MFFRGPSNKQPRDTAGLDLCSPLPRRSQPKAWPQSKIFRTRRCRSRSAYPLLSRSCRSRASEIRAPLCRRLCQKIGLRHYPSRAQFRWRRTRLRPEARRAWRRPGVPSSPRSGASPRSRTCRQRDRSAHNTPSRRLAHREKTPGACRQTRASRFHRRPSFCRCAICRLHRLTSRAQSWRRTLQCCGSRARRLLQRADASRSCLHHSKRESRRWSHRPRRQYAALRRNPYCPPR